MTRRGGEVDELWAAVVDPTRRRLLDALLVQREATATTLARELPVTRQAVAKHLAVLHRAGLVEGDRQGREVRYVVRPERLDAAARSMARVAAKWDERLLAIKRIAESSAREQPAPEHANKPTPEQANRSEIETPLEHKNAVNRPRTRGRRSRNEHTPDRVAGGVGDRAPATARDGEGVDPRP